MNVIGLPSSRPSDAGAIAAFIGNTGTFAEVMLISVCWSARDTERRSEARPPSVNVSSGEILSVGLKHRWAVLLTYACGDVLKVLHDDRRGFAVKEGQMGRSQNVGATIALKSFPTENETWMSLNIACRLFPFVLKSRPMTFE